MTISPLGFNASPVDLNQAKDAMERGSMPRVQHTTDPAVAMKTGREFEAMFLGQMLQPMFAGMNKANSYFGGGHGEEAFSSMLVDEYGKAIAEHGGVGIAKLVAKNILDTQDVANQAAARTASYQGKIATKTETDAEPQAAAAATGAKPLTLEEFKDETGSE
jgi:flagellar protein FlgJ